MTHFIAGSWVQTSNNSKLIESKNPSKGEVIWSGHAADQQGVDAAMHAARKAFKFWSRTPLEQRTQLLRNYQDLLKQNAEHLGQLISDETGKQLWEAKTEAAAMIGKVDLSIAAFDQRTGTTHNDINGVQTSLTHRPHGVMLVLGPYNFPGHLPNGHIVPALLAGNTIVFKPSELTPAVGQKMVELLAQAGLPDGVVNLIQGDGQTGMLCSAHAEYDGLLFTGSSATGAALHRQLAGQPDRILALEMGGNNPLIFHEVTDLKAAVYQTLQSAYITSGQRCTCARRLIVVDDDNGRAFVQALVTAVKAMRVGLTQDAPAFYGPVISNRVSDSLLDAQQAMLDRGGSALVTMLRLDPERPLLSPGLIDTTACTQRPDEEYFGPLLQLIWVDDLDQAIDEANNTRFGLAAGILTDNDQHWNEFYLAARAGILNRNRQTTGASGGAPFGGIGASGNHRPSAFYAADYCAYPMASMCDATPQCPEVLSPGITL